MPSKTVSRSSAIDGSPLPLGLFATNPPLTRFAVNVAFAFTTRFRTSELTFVVAVSASSHESPQSVSDHFARSSNSPSANVEAAPNWMTSPMVPLSALEIDRPPAAESELAAGVSIGRSLGLAIRRQSQRHSHGTRSAV